VAQVRLDTAVRKNVTTTRGEIAMTDFWKDYEPEPTVKKSLTVEETLDLAREALEKSVATCFDRCAHEQVMSRPEHFINQAITAIKQALAAPVQELHKGLSDHLAQATNGRVYVDPVTGDVGIGTSAAPDLQAELDATNRQVEILSDALSESRRQPQWVELTEDEIDEIFNNWPTYNLDHFEFGKVVEAKVFEKNGAIAVVIPDALNPKDENPAYAAGWNDCRAEMLKGMKP
jgi:hypothetical protein